MLINVFGNQFIARIKVYFAARPNRMAKKETNKKVFAANVGKSIDFLRFHFGNRLPKDSFALR